MHKKTTILKYFPSRTYFFDRQSATGNTVRGLIRTSCCLQCMLRAQREDDRGSG